MSLSEDLIARFARQLLVPGFGESAQERLLAARIRAVGADAVAGPGLVHLAQAGVGRIWVDDPEDVSPADLGGWLYGPSAVGSPRAEAARAALEQTSRHLSVEPYPVGGVPTAAFICAPSVAQALAAAETARRARLPHVVAEVDADGGAVVTVPPGAPCYACGRSVSGSGRPPQPGFAALSALAAAELVLVIANPGSATGRRIDLTRGVATVRPTVRLAGCPCGVEGTASS